MLDAVCTHQTSSAASRDSAVKLTSDSYRFWVAHKNLGVTFQSHVRFARKVQKYGDAFSKSSSICLNQTIYLSLVGGKTDRRTGRMNGRGRSDHCRYEIKKIS